MASVIAGVTRQKRAEGGGGRCQVGRSFPSAGEIRTRGIEICYSSGWRERDPN